MWSNFSAVRYNEKHLMEFLMVLGRVLFHPQMTLEGPALHTQQQPEYLEQWFDKQVLLA
jgi:hypothetical protein